MVIDPAILQEDIMRAKRYNNDMIVMLDPRAHMVTEEHKRRDAELEAERPIGSTKRGIGPAYSDRVLRTGITVGKSGRSVLRNS